MDNVCTTEGKITATIKISTPQTTSTQLPTVSLTSRISDLGQHSYVIQATYPHNSLTTEKGTFIQWHVNFKYMHQENYLTLLRGHPQLAHWNSNAQRLKEHQEGGEPTH